MCSLSLYNRFNYIYRIIKIRDIDLRIKEENLELVGTDRGGSEILHYEGKPFTGIMYEKEELMENAQNHLLFQTFYLKQKKY